MHITRIEIQNVPPLDVNLDVIFDCDKRVNLFIGPNASGKSTILRAIHGLTSNPSLLSCSDEYMVISSPDNFDDTPGTPKAWCWISTSDDWPRGDRHYSPLAWDPVEIVQRDVSMPNSLPFLYIPATRVSLRGRDIFNFNQIIGRVENDGTDDPLKDLFDTDSGVFYGQYVELAIDWLREKMAPTPISPEERSRDWVPTTGDRAQQTQLRKVIQIGYSCAKSICPEVIYDDAPHSFVELDDEREISDTGRVVHYGMGVGTTDNIVGEPLYAGALSSGTQGTLLWVWALVLKMAIHYDWTEGWEEKPAILLIDEIENHLHPTWQRRVIPALLKHFPQLQIFATTHSPFVVAGLKAGQVHLLKRDEYGHVTATTNTKNVIGWTADEILRTMMGVDDPTDDQTAAAARELRQLRNKGPQSTPEEEEQRQQQIRELRQYVDRDLLAGGPMEAQRELFEQQFAAALEKYRQSRDLGQENG